MLVDRVGIDHKFARALTHVLELDHAVRTYVELSPFRVEEQEDSESGDLVYHVRVTSPPPTDWSLLIGDAVHNARSALDHLACALVAGGGGTPSTDTYFPIADTGTGYGDRVRRGLRGASTASRDAVKTLQPWRGGDDLLWKLHRLDILDKHRLIVPVGAAQRGITLGGMFKGMLGSPPIKFPHFELLAADRRYPLQDGAEVFRVMKAARETEDSIFQPDHRITFEVAFGDGTVIPGEPLIPTLRNLIEHAASVVEPLVASLPHGL